jgi:hypothetical protein
VKKAILAGERVTDIANRFGVATGSVTLFAQKHGLKEKKNGGVISDDLHAVMQRSLAKADRDVKAAEAELVEAVNRRERILYAVEAYHGSA